MNHQLYNPITGFGEQAQKYPFRTVKIDATYVDTEPGKRFQEAANDSDFPPLRPLIRLPLRLVVG